MQKEVDELEDKDTWELVDLLPERKALGGRWVYRIKTDSQNNITKYKARWVVQGFNQISGIDYLETFSTVCRPETYRLFFIIAIANNWHLYQYDVKNAFVHAYIDAEIYVIPPTGFYNNNNKVCKLKKALYGLKQSPRLWYKFLSKILYKLGFHTFPYDDGAFINPNIQTAILYHVDDLIIIGPDKNIIEKIARESSKEIDLQLMGEINTFLGIDISIDRQNKELYMHQSKYTQNILKRYNKEYLYPVNTPSTGEKLLKNTGQATQGDIKLYQ
jgi:hypothetical protein